jgi:adenosine deaminase
VQRDLAEKIRNLPKAELHVHLEGSIGMETLNRLSKRKGQGPLRKNPYVFDRFEAFNEVFLFLSGLLKEEEDFYQVAMDFAARQADENIRYSEASFMPLFHISQGVPVEAVFRGIESGLAEGEQRHGARVGLICSIPRIAGPEGGEKTLDLIEQVRSKKIVGIDLAGTEKENDVAPFAGTFERAGDMGLKRVAHAGEFGSSKQISQSLDLLGVERIGHGISAIQDSALVHRLAQEGIALEISPTSNLKLKAVASVDAHPVRRLFEMGVPIVINTDDPAFFNTTLCREFQILADRLGFSEEEIEGLIANSFDYSFLEPDERRALRA